MHIRFDVDFDGYPWPGPLSGVDARFGHQWVGPRGFLGLLETQLGLGGPATPDGVRSAALVPAILSTEGFWTKSAQIDPIGVADTLLRWRDALWFGGWRGQPSAPRITELAAVTTGVIPGMPDRLDAVCQRLSGTATDIQVVELTEQRQHYPHPWQLVLTALESGGTQITELAAVAAAPSGDLLAARASGFEAMGDASLQLFRPQGPQLAADAVAAWLGALDDTKSTVIIGADPLLDAALHRHGLPTVGATGTRADTSLLEILPLVIQMGWSPPDPERALELLTLPTSPIPRGIRHRLVGALKQWPAVDSDAWRKALVEGLEKIEDVKDRQRMADRLAGLLQPSVTGTRYPVTELKKRVGILNTWLQGMISGTEPVEGGYQSAVIQCSNFVRLVDLIGLPDLNRPQLQRLLDDATSTVPAESRFPAQAGLFSVTSPGAIGGPADRIIWWNFTRESAAKPEILPLTPAERKTLSEAGVRLPEPDQVALGINSRWSRPLFNATANLMLVCPKYGYDGKDQHPHPLWDQIAANAEESKLNRLIVSTPLFVKKPKQHTPLPLVIPQPRREWRLPAGVAVPPRTSESPTGAGSLVGCSFKWTLEYAGKIDGGDTAELSSGDQLVGSVAHEILSRVLRSNPGDPVAAEKEAGRLFDVEGPRLAAVLFMPGMEKLKQRSRRATSQAARELVKHLRTMNLDVLGVEQAREGKAFGIGFNGRLDMIVGLPESVIDLKWGGEKYRKSELEAGAAYQLASYSNLIRTTGKFPPVAFFIINTQRMLTTHAGLFSDVTALEGAGPEEVWKAFERSYMDRQKELNSGLVLAHSDTDDNGDPVPEESMLGRREVAADATVQVLFFRAAVRVRAGASNGGSMNNIEIISASAGSGKTYRLTELLLDGVVNGTVRPKAVLATTFTNKSAAELQERVRMKLLAAGRITDAQQLTAARMGTVNAVCGRLVGDHAFELGLSPDLGVLDEEPAMLALNSQISNVLTMEVENELEALSERMPDFDWQKSVRSLVAVARSNAISAEELKKCAVRSWTEFQKLFGNPVDTADVLDARLLDALKKALAGVAKRSDSTKVTAEAVERSNQALRQLRRDKHIPWSEWLGLANVKAAKATDPLFEPVRIAASAQDRHPRLLSDVKRAIELVFELAIEAMYLYQQHKKEMGVIDFVDQETYALQLLSAPHVIEQLAGELDLVLIDEFQDTSPIQLAIFLRLAEAAKRSIWVGDQKQAIYGFRGTDPALMDAAIEEILAGKEPETLLKSYRSRPGLVHFSSGLFAPAFAEQGIPQSRVKLVPCKDNEPAGLGAFVEYWRLQTTNVDQDAAAVAAAAKALLADKSVTVRDRKDDRARPVRPGDVAILCLSNKQCLQVAQQLAALGIRPVLPRQGLMSTLEGRAALAGLRLWVDDRDSLAAAELARMIEFGGREDEWLATIVQKPGTEAFAAMTQITRIQQLRAKEPNLGVLAVFDSVVDSIGLAELCLRWGDVDARLANMEALRSHAVNYVNSCVSAGTGCTTAGLVAYLMGLANEGADGQGVDEDDHAVVVSTWHKAKGLEWPIVVLFPLNRRDPSTRALGLTVQTDQPRLTLSDPLAGRWIRFWPNPYSYRTRKSPFHDRLADHAATMAAMLQADREDLRLLYVGWTRARDRIALTGRPGKLTNGLLQLLQDKDGPLVDEPDGSTLTWAGQTVKVVIRDAMPLSPEARKPTTGTGYVAAGAREHPPAFVLPSSVAGAAVTLTEYERIGERVGVTGNDYASLGNAIHAFLCADRPGLKPGQRESLLGELLGRWSVTAAVDVPEVLAASDGLRAWVAGRWPDAKWHREWPVLWRNAEGSMIRGTTDLVLGVDGGLVVIDHKSFPGSVSQALARCAEYVGQLGSYTSAIETATGQKVLSQWVHLPVSGTVVPLSDKAVATTTLVKDTVQNEAPLAHPSRRPTMQKIEVILVKGKETKGTYVYEEELAEGGKPPVLKTQYIQKWALGSNPPEKIKVTIEAV